MGRHPLTTKLGIAAIACALTGTAAVLAPPMPGGLSASDLAEIRGLSSQTQAKTVYPISCAFYNKAVNEVTVKECESFMIVPAGIYCITCSDSIATFETVAQGGTQNLKRDVDYQCSGQKHRSPCLPSKQCDPMGWAPIPNVFCTHVIEDWDSQ